MADKLKTGSFLQGLSRLSADATIGITNLVEAMHRRVVHPPFLPSTPIQHLITGIAGITYKNVRWSTRVIGLGFEKALKQLTPVLGEITATDEREAIRSVLNGLVGDYLEEKENPLKITMQFRYESKAVALDGNSLLDTYPVVSGKVLALVHGSCMNDIQWTRKNHNHGLALEKDLGHTPVYLHYNSGRHISTNGQEFSDLLEILVQNWPVPIEELVIIGHSMGGLVSRSAVHYGQKRKKSWIKHLKKMIFLGSPHHGAPLERTGNYLDGILESIAYAKPFARLGKVRSAGITDLRYGNLIDEDWQGNDRFELKGDDRQHVPLPKRITCYNVAAVVGKDTDQLSTQLVGDTMVDINSALGVHENPSKHLKFKEENTWVAYELSHLGLLSDAAVYSKIKAWLS